jgi:hypothetical protein
MLYDKRLGNAMNSKKAVKKLDKITGILTSVIDGLPDRRKPAGVQKLLGSAKKAVAQARKAVKARSSVRLPRKPVQAETAQPRRRTGSAR